MKQKKNKIDDSQNIENFLKRKKLRWAIMIMSVVTIILALLSLTVNLGFGYPLVSYLITHVLISMRNKLKIQESDLVKSKRQEKLDKKNKKKEEKKISEKKKTKK